MLIKSQLHKYQLRAVEFIKKKQCCGLFIDLGMGKTVTTLTACSDLLDSMSVSKVLIIAPLRVANTVWHAELNNWHHLAHHTYSIATGSAKKRIEAIEKNAQFTIINADVIPWLVNNYDNDWLWDCIIFDESTLFKSNASKRFQAIKKVLNKATHRVILTATPAPNGFMDLWAQTYLIDQGFRLGRYITHFRGRYFDSDYMGYKWTIKIGAAMDIQRRISDICMTLKVDDYYQMPDKIVIDKVVPLPTKVCKRYAELVRHYCVQFENGFVEAANAAAAANKLLQMCNGAVYDQNGDVIAAHEEKLDALAEIVECNTNENLLVVYNYKFDKEQILKRFPQASVMDENGNAVEAWNKGAIKMLLVHPASASHGLNLQAGGSVLIWYGMTWNLEHYLQMNGRLHRQGQTKPVRIIRLIASVAKSLSLDEKIVNALEQKDITQDRLLDSLL